VSCPGLEPDCGPLPSTINRTVVRFGEGPSHAFTATGTVGATVVAVALHGERASAARLGAIALVVVGVVALRLTSDAG
jgi:hypothetical protein